MTDFVFPTRFDTAIADEGIWFEVVDELDNEWGSFKCVLLDRGIPRYQHAVERLRRKHNGKRKVSEDFKAELFVELALVDWKLKNAAGKDIPFTKESALSYFSNPRATFALDYLSALVEDVRNFQADEEEDVEGN